jgi:hypothetical protein
MRATIAWWDLAGSGQTIDSLRGALHEDGIEAWTQVPGLRLKFWISDRKTGRWGAVMLWDEEADPAAPLPPNLATELIGYPPTLRLAAHVEAVAVGPHASGAAR